jgi:hypothetical protein
MQSISVGAKPVQGETSVVALEMVGWLHATDSGQSDAAGMLSDFYQGLLAQIGGGVAGVDSVGFSVEAGSVDASADVSQVGDSL